MRKYILVSNKFEGYIAYGFNVMGFLSYFENCAWGMTEEQNRGVLTELRYGLGLDNFKSWVSDRGFKIINVEVDISFERFWMVFDNARNKKNAEALWSKMNAELRHYAFYVHESYVYWLKQNAWATKMYPDTFLRAHLHDEWFKTQSAPQKQAQPRDLLADNDIYEAGR